MNPHIVFVTPDAESLPLVSEIRRTLPNGEFIISSKDPLEIKPGIEPWRIIRIRRFLGNIIKEVNENERSFQDRREAYLACGINCPGRCAYCFLRECASVPYPEIYANLTDMTEDLRNLLSIDPNIYLHLGHVLDPLAYPFMAPLIRGFVDTVKMFPETTLEIRTKFTNMDLLPASPAENIVLAFSFSPYRIVKEYEKGVPGLESRLRAAHRAAQAGYRIGIRIDPILIYQGWRDDYAELCCKLVKWFPPDMVADIVAGTFRGPPRLISKLKEDDPATFIRRGEFVKISHGKSGYPRPVRIQALRFIATRLGGRYPLRFCFEDSTTQDAIFNR